MIVSHTHKFIFIKTQKTAGTSIDVFLSMYCSGNDIVTGLRPEDEIIRRKLGFFPMNQTRSKYNIPEERDVPLETAEEIAQFREKHHYKSYAKNYDRGRLRLGTHSTAITLRKKLGTLCLEDYYVFCIERNPWERTLSKYYYSRYDREVELATDEKIHAFVQKGITVKSKIQCNSRFYLSKGGKVIVDDVFDFANLDGAMQSVCNRFGFDFDKYKSLPKFKGGNRKDLRPYEEIFSNETIALIGKVSRKAVKIMGYKPRTSTLGQ